MNDFAEYMKIAGHFETKILNKSDDFDIAVMDAIVEKMFGGTIECVDSNGSEQEVLSIDGDKVVCKFNIFEREYSINDSKEYSFEEAEVTVSGIANNSTKVYEVDKIIEVIIAGKKINLDKPTKKSVSNKDIIKRWNERIVPNGWDKMGAQGAKNYLEKYGKNIGPEKLKMFADYANSLGLKEFAEEIVKVNDNWKIVTVEYAEENNFNGDIIDTIDAVGADAEPIIVETSIQELANRNIGTSCGTVGNTCYKEIAKEFPSVKVRACVFKQNGHLITSSVEMWITSEKMGDRVMELADDGDGSLRFEWLEEKGWCYFETE